MAPLEFAAFALGCYLAVRMIAALHGIVDVWNVMARAWPRAVADVLVWAIAIGVIVWLIRGPYLSALVWGLSGYTGFYLSLLPLMRLLVARRRTDRSVD